MLAKAVAGPEPEMVCVKKTPLLSKVCNFTFQTSYLSYSSYLINQYYATFLLFQCLPSDSYTLYSPGETEGTEK